MTFRTELLIFLMYLVGVFTLRKLGQTLCKTVLHKAPWIVCFLLLVTWGIGIALGFRYLALWLQVGLVLKILGYGAAAYASAPDYGWSFESSGPNQPQPRPMIMPQLSFLTFVVASIAFAFTIK
jgi:hypothetical protein